MRISVIVRLSAAALAILAWPGASRAEGDSLNDSLGTRAVGLGEAVRASASGAAATQVNPAGAALTQSYSLEGTYGFRPEDDATIAGAAVCDSVTNKVAACLYYNYFGASPTGGKRSLHDIGITVSVPVANKLYLGSTTRYVDYTETGSLADPEDDSRDGGFIMDYGLILKLAPQFAVAGVAYNLIGSDAANFPRGIGSGLSVNLGERFVLGADAVWNLQAPEGTKTGRYGAGGELFLTGDGGQQGYPLRIGYVFDTSDDSQYVTGGLGFVTPRVGLDVGVRKQVGGEIGDEVMVQFGLRLFMPQ